MKITEISGSTVTSQLDEGVMDTVKSVAGAVAQPIKTATNYLQQRPMASAGNKQIDDITKRLMANWQTQAQALKAGGINIADTKTYQDNMLNWMAKSAFKRDINSITKLMGPLPSTGPAAINDYLRKGVGLYMAGQFGTGAGGLAGTPPAGNTGAPGGDTTGNIAGNTAGNTAGNAAGTTTTTAPDPAREPLFKDPALFKAEWDKYVSAQSQPYQLISDVRMLEVLKSMWMRTGGTKLAGNELPKTVNDKFGNPVQQPATQPAAGAPYQRKTFRFNEGKKAK